MITQGSKIALVHSYLQVPQGAGQVKILIFLLKIKYFPINANNVCDAGQVLILRYFEACNCIFVTYFNIYLYCLLDHMLPKDLWIGCFVHYFFCQPHCI